MTIFNGRRPERAPARYDSIETIGRRSIPGVCAAVAVWGPAAGEGPPDLRTASRSAWTMGPAWPARVTAYGVVVRTRADQPTTTLERNTSISDEPRTLPAV